MKHQVQVGQMTNRQTTSWPNDPAPFKTFSFKPKIALSKIVSLLFSNYEKD
jgi:hypothetical protein